MVCRKCYGTGRFMGNGMIYEDCECEDMETVSEHKPIQIDKRSKAYREAINKLMISNEVGREEATKMFESEFDKIA